MWELSSPLVHLSLDLDRGAELRHLGPDARHNVLASYDWEAPLPAQRSLSFGDDRRDWLSSYRGGWQELFPNAGLGCEVDGVPLPFHGEVSLARWEVVDHGERTITVQCPARLPLVVERRITLLADRPTMQIQETVRNVSGRRVRFLWGHHPAYDSPPGTIIDLPEGSTFEIGETSDDGQDGPRVGSRGVWPHAPTSVGGQMDLSVVPAGPVTRVCYLRDGAPWYALRPPSGPGIAVAWDARTFPALWLWQDIGGSRYPTYGRARITALEPQRTTPGMVSRRRSSAGRRWRSSPTGGGRPGSRRPCCRRDQPASAVWIDTVASRPRGSGRDRAAIARTRPRRAMAPIS